MKRRLRPFLKAGALALLVAAGAVASERYELAVFFAPERLEAWLAGAGWAAAPIFVGAMAAAVVISPIPSLPLDVLAGTLFGPVLGTLYAAVGATLGAVLAFLLARLLGRELLARFLRGHIHFCRRCSDKLLTKVVFVSRLLPFVSFDVVSYGAGFTRMSLWKFAAATFLGTLPLTALFTTYGSAVLQSPLVAWLGGVAMVALFFLLPRWIERYDLFSMRRFFEHPEDGT